jgi:hypothetical protein
MSGLCVYQASGMTFELPAIHPESMSSAEITSHKPTYQVLAILRPW